MGDTLGESKVEKENRVLPVGEGREKGSSDRIQGGFRSRGDNTREEFCVIVRGMKESCGRLFLFREEKREGRNVLNGTTDNIEGGFRETGFRGLYTVDESRDSQSSGFIVNLLVVKAALGEDKDWEDGEWGGLVDDEGRDKLKVVISEREVTD